MNQQTQSQKIWRMPIAAGLRLIIFPIAALLCACAQIPDRRETPPIKSGAIISVNDLWASNSLSLDSVSYKTLAEGRTLLADAAIEYGSSDVSSYCQANPTAARCMGRNIAGGFVYAASPLIIIGMIPFMAVKFAAECIEFGSCSSQSADQRRANSESGGTPVKEKLAPECVFSVDAKEADAGKQLSTWIQDTALEPKFSAQLASTYKAALERAVSEPSRHTKERVESAKDIQSKLTKSGSTIAIRSSVTRIMLVKIRNEAESLIVCSETVVPVENTSRSFEVCHSEKFLRSTPDTEAVNTKSLQEALVKQMKIIGRLSAKALTGPPLRLFPKQPLDC